ncbi:MAG: thiamine-phosphate kinase [Candidatus Thorarchaeota archaeon]
MKTGEQGERNFLKSISHMVNRLPGSKLGFDDDASDIPLSDGKHLVINVDTFVRETDWLPDMTAAQVGRKTAVMTLSDIVAKGATPTATMLSLCVPSDYESEPAQEIVRGFSQYCMKVDIPFIGGDLGSSSDVVLTGVALGVAPPEDIVTRSGAQDGDTIAVTGKFGLTSVAYEILLRGRDADDALRNRAIKAAYKPQIIYDLIPALARKGAITSSMDSSDGLGITLHTMANLSELGFVVEKLPVASGVESFSRNNLLDTTKMVMQGGEEFILVVTVPNEKWDIALDIAQEYKVPLQEIGTVQKGEGVVYESSEGYVKISSDGYDTFKEWK